MDTAAQLARFLDDRRNERLDVVDWLLSLDEELFRRHVADDVYKRAGESISGALRHPKLTVRWFQALGALRADVKQQLKTVRPTDRPDYAEWRAKAGWFLTHIDNTERELRALTATRRADPTKAQAANRERRTAHEEAVGRLIEAHHDEYLLYLVEEQRVRGLALKDHEYRQIRRAVGRAGPGSSADAKEPVE